MKTIKPLKLGMLTRNYEYERTFYCGVSVLAFVPLGSTPDLLSEVSMWTFLPDELGKDAALDDGIPKRNGEFLLKGKAFPPGDGPREKCLVRARLDTVEKTLYVFGDRYWQGRNFTDPLPFDEMPLDWEHAFGGEAYKQNPLGKGFKPVEVDGRKVYPLPNVEYPKQLVTSTKHRPEPAGFGPIDLMWPQRSSKVGTHKKKWLQEDFPGFARDIDWTFFNVSPADQQQPRPFRGDESYLLENLHAERRIIEGRLPALRARALITRRGERENVFEEIPTELMTVWFFPHAERAVLVYQGKTVVKEEDASDIAILMLAAEHSDRPKELGHYQDVLARRLDPEKGHLYALKDSELLPEDIRSDDPALTAEIELMTGDQLFKKRQRRKAEREIEAARQSVIDEGLDPAVFGPADLPPDEGIPSLEEIPDKIEEARVQIEEMARREEEDRLERAEEARALCEQTGMDYDLLVAEQNAEPRGPPQFTAEGVREELRQLADLLRAHDVDVEFLEGIIADEEMHERNFGGEQKMLDAYRMGAHLQSPALALGEEKSEYLRGLVQSTHAAGKSFAGYDLTGADLSRLDLRGADFGDAFLESVRFDSADLEGARFKGAVLAHASFRAARLAKADLTGANLGGAKLERTQADGGVSFRDAVLMNADLGGANLRDANLEGANLMRASLGGTDLSGAKAFRLFILQSDLRGLRIGRARFESCVFAEVDCREVDFSGAFLTGCVFVKADGRGSRFRGAHMTKCCFVENCDFAGADFTDAGMEAVMLRGTNLAGANFTRARLDRADLSECDVTGGRLYRALLRDALLMKTRLDDAVMVSTNLMGAILQHARLRGTDLRGSNLYGADLARIRRDERTRMDGTLTHRTKDIPKHDG